MSRIERFLSDLPGWILVAMPVVPLIVLILVLTGVWKP